MTGVQGTDSQADEVRIGTHTLHSRLIVGTGKYETFELMQQALELSGTDCVTVAVRRERLMDKDGRNILDFLDHTRYTHLCVDFRSYAPPTTLAVEAWYTQRA